MAVELAAKGEVETLALFYDPAANDEEMSNFLPNKKFSSVLHNGQRDQVRGWIPIATSSPINHHDGLTLIDPMPPPDQLRKSPKRLDETINQFPPSVSMVP